MGKRKANEQGRAVLARLQQENQIRSTQTRAGETYLRVETPPEPEPRPPQPRRREVINYAAERLECIHASLQYRVLGRDGHSLNIVEIQRADRGILEVRVNGRPDHSNHANEAMQKAEFFFNDMALMTARTLNSRA